MKNIRLFLSENFHFLVVKFSVYLNRRVFVMCRIYSTYLDRQAWENNVDPDKLPQNAATDQDLHCLPIKQQF